jgi:hypothetical protein
LDTLEAELSELAGRADLLASRAVENASRYEDTDGHLKLIEAKVSELAGLYDGCEMHLSSMETKLAELTEIVFAAQQQGQGICQERLDSIEVKLAEVAAQNASDVGGHEDSEMRAMLVSMESKFAELARVRRQQEEDQMLFKSVPESLTQLKADMLSEMQALLSSRDKNLSWLSDLRPWLLELRAKGDDASPAVGSVPLSGQQANAQAEERPIPQEDSRADPLVSPTLSRESQPEASGGFRVGSSDKTSLGSRSFTTSPAGASPLAAKFAEIAAERGDDPKAVANLYKWFNTASGTKANDLPIAETRGRPKSKTAAPTRELIRAAAQELVNIKKSEAAQ